jgi:hypothetical protein
MGALSKNAVSTFELGVNHEDPRVRELFREKRDKTLVIAHDLYVGRAWMSPGAGEYNVPSNRLTRYRHGSEDLDAGTSFISIKSSETFYLTLLGMRQASS